MAQLRLGNIVFAKRDKMEELANVTYTYISKEISRIIDET